MKTATCPSCGAPVAFRSAASLYAVCEFCRSTLLRHGDDIENLGRMADLLEDASRIQLGSEGRYRGVHFAVIGRIQLKHDAGLWNEWHILFDDGRSGWLSEASGEYVVSALVPVAEVIPAFESLEPEMAVTLAGRSFTVTDLATARCIAGAGELPFKVEAGYDVNTADLRSEDRFVTLDYSETPPLVFVGYPAKFAELSLTNLRPTRDESGGVAVGGTADFKVRAFNCPHCASPLTLHSPAIESVGCESCGSIIGVENENIRLLARAAQTVHEMPTLPLGSKGVLAGIDWEIIGFLKRRTTVEGIDYDWSEYLLFNAGDGSFAWLVEDQGHWNFARTLSDIPRAARGQHELQYGGEKYRLFNSGQAEVTYVVGEFYWRVAVGERCLTEDYVCAPRMLSREVSEQEASWSGAEYVEAAAVARAFAPAAGLRKPVGVYANQPNPYGERHRRVCRLFWGLAAVALVLQLAFVLAGAAGTVLKHHFVLSPGQEATATSPEFVLPGHARTLRLTHATDVSNNWLSLSTTLVDKHGGRTWAGFQEVAYYHGVDGGEGWSEGAKDDDIVFRDVPPGTYYLVVDYEVGRDRSAAIVDRIELARNAPGWSNYVLLMLFLVAFPLFARWRRAAFETQRWNESGIGGDESDDDDGGDD